MNRLSILAAATAVLACTAALADDAAAPTNPNPVDTLGPPPCKKPVIHHKVGASDDGDLNDNAGNYRDCINTYVADQKTLSAKHIEAANAAVKEYNEFMQAYTDYKNQNR